jgi:uncharacterized Rossmann fold enzyme
MFHFDDVQSDDTVLTAYSGIVQADAVSTAAVIAYSDPETGPQSLLVAGTSNVVIEAPYGVSTYTSNGGVSHYLVGDSNGERQDILAFRVSKNATPCN